MQTANLTAALAALRRVIDCEKALSDARDDLGLVVERLSESEMIAYFHQSASERQKDRDGKRQNQDNQAQDIRAERR